MTQYNFSDKEFVHPFYNVTQSLPNRTYLSNMRTSDVQPNHGDADIQTNSMTASVKLLNKK